MDEILKEEKKIIIPPPEIEIDTNWTCWELPTQAFIDTSKIIPDKIEALGKQEERDT
jgi:hypothetical protein